MQHADPQILAPGPGLPCLLERPDDSVAVYVLTSLHDDELRTWATALYLARSSDDLRIDLIPAEIVRLERSVPPPLVATAVAVAPSGGDLVRISLAVGAVPSRTEPRRYRLYGLWRDNERLRSRCVALRTRRDDRLALAFGSDLHVAAIWDAIDGAMARYAPDLYDSYLHPGRLLRRFVARANVLAAEGNLDLVVFGGDLVDHVRSGPQANGNGSNVDHFAGIVEDLEVPTLVIPGNHDFRLHAWRPRIYPYASIAIPSHRAASALRRAGLWDSAPWRLSDLRALETSDENGRTALADHLLQLAPAIDYTIDLDEMTLVFLSTGRDVLPRWRTVERGRRRVFLRALPRSWEHPDSEGLAPAQIARADAALRQSKATALFFHAPLFNPKPGMRIESRLPRLDPGDDEGRAATGRFERHLARTGMRQGVFFRNPGALVRALAGATGNTVVFSGHVHQPHAAAFDPATRGIRSVPLPWLDPAGDHVALLNAPALGQTAMSDGQPPGFLHAHFSDGKLRSVANHILQERA